MLILHIEWALINWFSARSLCSSLPMVGMMQRYEKKVRSARPLLENIPISEGLQKEPTFTSQLRHLV